MKKIKALIASINERPLPNHSDLTPAVLELGKMGVGVVPHVLPLILNDDESVRERAQRVLERVTSPLFGFVQNQGWGSVMQEQRWKAFWKELGGLNPDLSKEDRNKCLELWTAWYKRYSSEQQP